MTEKRTIKSKEEAKIFAMFLCCERNRHIDDVRNAEVDLLALKKKWEITIPWGADYFTVVDKS
jgi:hypothetical protein